MVNCRLLGTPTGSPSILNITEPLAPKGPLLRENVKEEAHIFFLRTERLYFVGPTKEFCIDPVFFRQAGAGAIGWPRPCETVGDGTVLFRCDRIAMRKEI